MSKPDTPVCDRCKYELSNCPTGACPECGTDQAVRATPAVTSSALLGVSVLPALIVLAAMSFFSLAGIAQALGLSQNSAALGVLVLGAIAVGAHVYVVIRLATRSAEGARRYRNSARTAEFVVLAVVVDCVLWWAALFAVVGLV